MHVRVETMAKNAGLVAASILVAFLICEVGIRLLPNKWVPELGDIQPKEINLTGFMARSSNPRLYYEPRPGVEDVNEQGYRGLQYTQSKPSGVQRIVGIGDSTAWGQGIAEKDAYLRRLETKLNDDGSLVEVVNLAVGGYNTHQELEMLLTRGVEFSPDLVILGYDHNDTKPILGRIPRQMHADYGRNILHSELIRYLIRKLHMTPRLRIRNNIDGYQSKGRGWNEHMEALIEIAEVCRQEGVPLLVVVYDSTIHREERAKSRHYRLLHEPLLELWSENGVHVLDCYDLFQDYMQREGRDNTEPLWVSIDPRDGHPNPKGHEIIATAVHGFIRDNELLPQERARR